MSQQQTNTKPKSRPVALKTRLANSHYAILGLHPSASVIEVRRAYRELSKKYHPDTTQLPPDIATSKFQRLNEAYAILSHPERRSLYDLQIGYSRWNVIQVTPDEDKSHQNQAQWSKSMYLDPTDRPLSSGELFALVLMGFTLIGCLLLAIAIACFRGDPLLPESALPNATIWLSLLK